MERLLQLVLDHETCYTVQEVIGDLLNEGLSMDEAQCALMDALRHGCIVVGHGYSLKVV